MTNEWTTTWMDHSETRPFRRSRTCMDERERAATASRWRWFTGIAIESFSGHALLERWRREHASLKESRGRTPRTLLHSLSNRTHTLINCVGYCNIRYFELCVKYQATFVVQFNVDLHFMKTKFHSPVHCFEFAVSVQPGQEPPTDALCYCCLVVSTRVIATRQVECIARAPSPTLRVAAPPTPSLNILRATFTCTSLPSNTNLSF
jgi:hypothetical protein